MSHNFQGDEFADRKWRATLIDMAFNAYEKAKATTDVATWNAQEQFSENINESIEKYTQALGEKCPELYGPLMLYAKALLNKSRSQQPVIANAHTGVDETTTTANTDAFEEKPSNAPIVGEQDNAPIAEEPIDDEDENNESMSTDADEFTTIQLAFDNCETAYDISVEQLAAADAADKSMWELRVCEALLLFIEVCIDAHKIAQALVYCEAARIALTSISRYSEAADVYRKAMEVITQLKQQTEETATSTDDGDAKDALVRETDKLDALLAAIHSWVQDSVESASRLVAAVGQANIDESAGQTTSVVCKRKADSPVVCEAPSVVADVTATVTKENGDVKKAKLDDQGVSATTAD